MMDLQEMGCENMDWIVLAQERDSCEGGNEPTCSAIYGDFLTDRIPVSFSGRTALQGVSESVVSKSKGCFHRVTIQLQ